MQLLDRYLTAVKFWLPKKHRDDIAAELAANLQSEIDDRAAEEGRPLSDDEVAALLKQHGPPFLVASRFQQPPRTVSFGRELIGPVVFPFYWIAIKVTLLLLLIPAAIPALVLESHFRVTREVIRLLYRMLHLALPTLFFVTLAFALFDFCLREFHLFEKWTTAWDPRELPAPAEQKKQVRRSSSIAGIILTSIFILWWMNHDVPVLVVGESGGHLQFAPIWQALHLPILLVGFVCLAQHWINLAQPNWRWLPPTTGLINSIAGLIIVYPLLTTHPLLLVTDAKGVPINAADATQLQQILWLALFSVWIGMIIVGVVYAWRLVWIAWQAMPQSGAPRANGVAHI